ncbi:unnamed protein product, partial [Didymodactylos carnosus]
ESNGGISGQAIFPNDSLPKSDEEFYQFCYILSSTNRSIGSSIPFQLNCLDDDICDFSGDDEHNQGHDSTHAVNKRSGNDLVTIDLINGETNGDDSDFIVIQTKHILKEKKLKNDYKQVLSINRKLEKENDQLKMQIDQIEMKSNEIINKMNQDIIAMEKQCASLIGELKSYSQHEISLKSDYLKCRELCQIQIETNQLYASKLSKLEDIKQELETKAQKDQLVYDDTIEKLQQQTQMCIAQKTQIGDMKMTYEKRMISMQKQIDIEREKCTQLSLDNYGLVSTYEQKLIELNEKYLQVENQIKTLTVANEMLKNELKEKQRDNQQLECLCLEKDEKLIELEGRYHSKQCEKEIFQQQMEQAKSDLESIRTELEELKSNQQSHNTLKMSYSVVEKRCLKHQKQEKQYKKQVDVLKSHIREQQNEINELRDRLHEASCEYKNIYREFLQVQRHSGSLLINDKELISSAVMSDLLPKMKMADPIQIPSTQVSDLSTTCPVKDLVWDAEKKFVEQNDEQQSYILAQSQKTTTMSDETGINEEMLMNLLRERYSQDQINDDDQAQSSMYESDLDLDDVGSALLLESDIDSVPATDFSDEIKECPMCNMKFLPNLTLNNKQEHIEGHFDNIEG